MTPTDRPVLFPACVGSGLRLGLGGACEDQGRGEGEKDAMQGGEARSL